MGSTESGRNRKQTPGEDAEVVRANYEKRRALPRMNNDGYKRSGRKEVLIEDSWIE